MAFVTTRCFGLRNGLFRLQSRLESGRMVRYFAEGTRTVQAEVIGTKTSTISSRLAENWGRAFVGGSCIAGIGAMCFYGLGLSKEAGAIDKAAFWDPVVRERIRKTYLYFAADVALIGAAAAVASRTSLTSVLSRVSPLAYTIGCLVASTGCYYLIVSTPYENTVPKHAAWALFSGVWGVFLAPMAALGGPLLTRALLYTGAVVSGLTLTAASAPSEKFLYWAGPLAVGLGVVCVSSLGSVFLGPASALGSGLYSLSMYGGLVLFGGFMLYDTQKIIRDAETKPHFDPINASMGIYMDALNIFIRIAMILASNQSKKK